MRDRLWYAVFLAALAPFLYGVFLAASGGFGANPIKEATHYTGDWALRLLLVTLALTPLRRITRRNVFVRFRRMLGLYAFFYATLHFGIWLVVDQFFDWGEIVRDIAKRPYITVGFAAFVLLVPLALTSTRAMVARLGTHWRRLHSAVYLVGTLAVIHFLWLVKADKLEPLIYGSVFVLLLVLRLPVPEWWRQLPTLPWRRAEAKS